MRFWHGAVLHRARINRLKESIAVGKAKTMNQTFGRADMHMHTDVSDGVASVQDLLAYMTQHRQLDVIAITDHDRLDASLWAYEHQQAYPFEIIPGVEVTSREGHVLAWWITENIPAGLRLEETVQAIHEAGGVAVLAHPFHIHVTETRQGIARYVHDVELIERAGFDAVEVVNAGAVFPGMNLYARIASRPLNVAFVGNSDAHTPNATGSASTSFTGSRAADLRRAIEKRETSPNGGIWSLRAYGSYIKHYLNGSIRCEDVVEIQGTR